MMKKSLRYLPILMLGMVACQEEKATTSTPENTNTVAVAPTIQAEEQPQAEVKPTATLPASTESNTVFQDFTAITKLEGNPVTTFQKQLEQKAAKVIVLTKENMPEVLSLSESYQQVYIITGNHTVAKILDLKNSLPSGAWACKMPQSEGYIKKGAMKHTTDYLNNIIGVPDQQKRTVYFIN